MFVSLFGSSFWVRSIGLKCRKVSEPSKPGMSNLLSLPNLHAVLGNTVNEKQYPPKFLKIF